MQEIVHAIRRVTDIVAEISMASVAQAGSLGEVGLAVAQMDEVTQRNAVLVEESAAAAEGLKCKAAQLVETVAVFRQAAPGRHLLHHPLLKLELP